MELTNLAHFSREFRKVIRSSDSFSQDLIQFLKSVMLLVVCQLLVLGRVL